MRDPFKVEETTIISFSGGRTSAYLLHRVLEANGGPNDLIHPIFCNTGKEMPETLDFIEQCSVEWGVPITWLEYAGRELKPGVKPEDVSPGRKCFDYSFKIVNYGNASRNGEPFDRLIEDMQYLPNPMSRWCSGQLKQRTIGRYIQTCLLDEELPIRSLIGIRADEPRRVAKLHGEEREQQYLLCPLYKAGITRQDVGNFWSGYKFDLALPNNQGVTDWGNCDLCFLKGHKKKVSIMRARPDLAQWWIEKERRFGDHSVFRRESPDYATMLAVASSNVDMFADAIDDSVPCYCGD